MDGCYIGEIFRIKSRRYIKRYLVLPVHVAPENFWGKGDSLYPKFNPILVNALIDTGATHSGITSPVAELLGVVSTETENVISADGLSMKNTYDISVSIPLPFLPTGERVGTKHSNFKEISSLRVVEFFGDQPKILLGMDVFTEGSLKLKGNEFTFCLSISEPECPTIKKKDV